jgi:hypothetical protein
MITVIGDWYVPTFRTSKKCAINYVNISTVEWDLEALAKCAKQLLSYL